MPGKPCVYKDLFLPSHRCLTPPSWGTPCNINAVGYNSVVDNTGPSSVV